MGILLLIVTIMIGILFALRLYSFENSEFRKITGHSLYSIWANPHVKNTYKLVQSLKYLQGEHKLLVNVAFNGAIKNIDAIVIHESGIYIFSIQSMNGWIYGREQDGQWAQAVHKQDKLNTFENPINEMKRAVLNLKESLTNVKEDLFHSIVLFTDSCSLKKIMTKSNNVTVIKVNELKRFWKKRTDKKLTVEDIQKIHHSLEQFVNIHQPSYKMNMDQATTNH